MDWIPLNEDILTSCFNPTELKSVTAKRDEQDPDPVPVIIGDVAADIRTRLVSSGRVTMKGDETYIPRALSSAARALIRYELLTAFSLNITEPRTKQWEQAQKTLEDISSGSYVLTDESDKTPSPSYRGRPQRFGPNPRGTIM